MNCIVCDTPNLIFDFARTPISGYRCKSREESLKQPKFNLSFNFCPNCNMVKYPMQKGADVLLDKLYSEHVSTYYYTKYLNDYMNNFVKNLSNKYSIDHESTVVEIGCNSGRLLTMFREETSCKILGVEPSKTFTDEWNDNQIEVINDYFSNDCVEIIRDRIVNLVIIRHVFEHIPNPVIFFSDLSKICSNETTIIIEVPYFKEVLKRRRIENVSFSHLNYFCIRSMNEIAKRFGFGIVDYELVETDGGSIVYHIQKGKITDSVMIDNISESEINDFISYIDQARLKIKNILSQYKKNEIVGYGAGSKGPHLVYLLGLDEFITHVVDDTPGYSGMFLPGTEIEICNADIFTTNDIKCVLNLAPTHSDVIKNNVPSQIDFYEVI